MTNHWIDFKNADCILVMGSNPACNHPVSFKWIMAAMEKGAQLVCVDPRVTQTAARSHLYAPLRSGTDIAFLGGMIKYILENKLYFEEYMKDYTNASFLVNPDFKLPGDNEGVFSSFSGFMVLRSTIRFFFNRRNEYESSLVGLSISNFSRSSICSSV